MRKWINKVDAIKNNDGEWIHDKELVKEHIVSYFTHLFAADEEPTMFNVPYDIFP